MELYIVEQCKSGSHYLPVYITSKGDEAYDYVDGLIRPMHGLRHKSEQLEGLELSCFRITRLDLDEETVHDQLKSMTEDSDQAHVVYEAKYIGDFFYKTDES